MITVPPFLTLSGWIAFEYFGGSLLYALAELHKIGLLEFLKNHGTIPDGRVAVAYFCWVVFQALLYTVLPGRSSGQLTAGGELLHYNTNGLSAWAITVSTFTLLSLSGTIDPSIIARYWGSLIIVFNCYGYILSVIAYVKAHYAPSYSRDRNFSGSVLYDFFMGIEFNPRFGQGWDWKLFHNGRPGIIGWSLMLLIKVCSNISYGALQYRVHGYVTNSMVLINLFQAIYVIDFFVNESWYLRTIDICHDHFGFYLAWGSAAWLPTMYTLQAQYLSRHPVHLSPLAVVSLIVIDLGGYLIFRSANAQKDRSRRNNGNCNIWGRKAEVMRCSFKTADGKEHTSLLLLSGWWGVARHSNYVGDLLQAYAMCALCGTEHLLPWTYAIFMTWILWHRCYRDEKRCSMKYGDQWKEYCSLVKWRMVPGVW
ncbi:7-dehydrocholesterol reductase [Fusarium longipes]|uniref:7-dehydrocholesterol reductase n=1 Tax=Fusarium longipes TaxID=694270 RepID=A0A395T5V1_9HYPO|nr:7-dehydrocholesterol reductase [Fusarium longipes]